MVSVLSVPASLKTCLDSGCSSTQPSSVELWHVSSDRSRAYGKRSSLRDAKIEKIVGLTQKLQSFCRCHGNQCPNQRSKEEIVASAEARKTPNADKECEKWSLSTVFKQSQNVRTVKPARENFCSACINVPRHVYGGATRAHLSSWLWRHWLMLRFLSASLNDRDVDSLCCAASLSCRNFEYLRATPHWRFEAKLLVRATLKILNKLS